MSERPTSSVARSRFRSWWSAVIATNCVVIAIVCAHYSRRAPVVPEEPLPFGHVVSSEVLVVLNRVLPPGWKFVIVFEPDPGRRSDYAQHVHRKHQGAGLEMLRLGGRDDRSAADGPAVWGSDEARIRTALHVPPGHDHGATVVVASSGAVVFSTLSALDDDSLRQLAERYVTGYADLGDHPVEWTAIARVGERFPDVAPRALDGTAIDIAAGSLVVVLSGSCLACEFASWLGALHTLAAPDSPSTVANVLLVPEDSQSVAVLADAQARRLLPMFTFGTVPADKLGRDPYWTRYAVVDAPPRALWLDERRIVARSLSLDGSQDAY